MQFTTFEEIPCNLIMRGGFLNLAPRVESRNDDVGLILALKDEQIHEKTKELAKAETENAQLSLKLDAVDRTNFASHEEIRNLKREIQLHLEAREAALDFLIAKGYNFSAETGNPKGMLPPHVEQLMVQLRDFRFTGGMSLKDYALSKGVNLKITDFYHRRRDNLRQGDFDALQSLCVEPQEIHPYIAVRLLKRKFIKIKSTGLAFAKITLAGRWHVFRMRAKEE